MNNYPFFSQPEIQALAIALLAIVSDAIWRWPRAYHPLTLMRYLAEAMATRVRPGHNDTAFQHSISGSLGAIVLVAPLVILLAMLVYMAEYPLFFEAVILLSVLDFGHDRACYNQVLHALGKEKKVLARHTLKTIVARDTDRLSPVGVAKAAIESLLLRFYYLYCGVLFWFVLAGPVAALTYRLLLLLSWQWHRRRPGFMRFSQPVTRLVHLAAIIPCIIGAIIMALVTHPVKAFKGARKSPAKDGSSLLLAMFGNAMGIQLGGPAIYHGIKLRYPRVGGGREVRFSDLTYTKRAITRAVILFATLLCLFYLAVYRLTL